jgi:hypothetical protein
MDTPYYVCNTRNMKNIVKYLSDAKQVSLRITGIAILALTVLAVGAQAKEKDQTPHSGVVSNHLTQYDSWTDTTKCYRGLDDAAHCSGGVSQDQRMFWYVTEQDGTVYQFDRADGNGFTDGYKLEYSVENGFGFGQFRKLHVTNFKTPNGKEIKILAQIMKSEKPQKDNRPVPVTPAQ